MTVSVAVPAVHELAEQWAATRLWLSVGVVTMDPVPATSIRFATAARSLAEATRAQGLCVPGFRSPPRVAGVTRSLRRRPDGCATVAVVIRGRPWVAVLADMVEGVVVANRLEGPDADRCRTALWSAVEGGGLQAA